MGRKLLFLQTEDWTFWSHRLPLARAAKSAGYEVVVALRVDAHGERLRSEGFRVVPLDWRRNSVNPVRELLMLLAIVRLYAREKPDIVHQVTAKPIIYGSIAARLCGVRAVLNAMTGLGFVFMSEGGKARLLKPFVRLALKFAFTIPNSRTIFENPDDRALFVGMGLLPPERTAVIPGTGVDIEEFRPTPESAGAPVVVLPCRMLWDKGVGEFVEAAGMLKAAGVEARMALVGDSDSENLTAVPISVLSQWKKSGVIEWWGRRTNMQEVYAQSHIVCLPSYREGLPVTLMEGAACGRPLVATDVPGCREVVRNGVNGFLVPARDARGLAAALRLLLEDAGLRRRMGSKARDTAVEKFAQEKTVRQYLALYQKLAAASRRNCASFGAVT